MFKNSGLRAAISEPNLKKKASTSSANGTIVSSSRKKGQLAVSATAANIPRRSPSSGIEKSPKNQVSSSEESDQDDQTNFLTNEIIQKLKKYDPDWFECIRKSPKRIRNTSSIPSSMPSSNVLNAEHHVQTGFDFAYFGQKTSIIFSDSRFIRHIEPNEYPSSVKTFNVGSSITAMQISPDYSYLAISVEDERGAHLIVYDTETFEASAKYDVRVVANELQISATNEVVWVVQGDSRAVTLMCYGLFEGKIIAGGKVNAEIPIKSWQVSLCPADDAIACLLVTNRAILLRISGGNIENFSEIEFFDVVCHDWSNDVTLAFGASSCQIRLYRETSPLGIVDLRKLSSQLLSDSESPVTLMYSTAEKFSCVVAGMLMFVFDVKNGDCQWDKANTIVMLTIGSPGSVKSLSLDSYCDNYLYSDGNALWMGSLRYSDAVCGSGATVVFMRHTKAIVSLHVSLQCQRVASLDCSGMIIVAAIQTQVLIAYGILEGAIWIALMPYGHSLVVAFPTKISLYHIMHHSLRESKVLMEGNVGKIAVDIAMEQIAVSANDELLIFELNSLQMAAKLPLLSKQEVRSLKWSHDGIQLGVLSVSDGITIINANTHSILWNIALKMRFFVDIAVENGAIYALNKKFVITKFFNAKEIEQISAHSPEIGFNGTSVCLTSGYSGHLIGSSTGHLVHLPFDVLDDITILHTHIPSAITLMSSTEHCSLLYVGFEDGHVAYFRFEDFKNVQHEEELVLCPLDELSNLKMLVKELDVERNFIRRETEKVIRECQYSKDAEMKAMREQLQENCAVMNEKVERIEEKLENVQLLNGVAMENLRKLYEDETLSQKQHYEKTLEDQIRNSLKNEEYLRKRIEQSERYLKSERHRYISSFNFTEGNLRTVINDQQQYIIQLKEAVEREKHTQYQIIIRYEDEIKNIKERQKFISESHMKELLELENELRLLKTTCIILTEERDEARNAHSETRAKLDTSEQDKSELRKQLDREQQTIEKERSHLKHLQDKEAISREKVTRLTHHLAVTQKELQREKAQHKISRGKLQEIHARIDELSKNVYNSRKLEHNVLSLIAFIGQQ